MRSDFRERGQDGIYVRGDDISPTASREFSIAPELEPELKDFIDEEMFRLCEMDTDDDVRSRINAVNASDDSTALDLHWMLDTTNTDALLAKHAYTDFSDLFSLPISAAAGARRVERPKKVAVVEKRNVRSTSSMRGVTHHCRTGKYEAHIWESGKQVYLGGFDSEEQAALAYDVIAVKCRGIKAQTNFDMRNYAQELANLDGIEKDDLVLSLRRQSKGHAKGSSKFRGVTKHAKGKFEARIGQMVGKKYRYLGLFDTESEAAVAYDIACVREKGLQAVTNFDISEYSDVLAQHYNGGTTSSKRKRHYSASATPVESKICEKNFRDELAGTHIDISSRALKPGRAIERDPSDKAVDLVRHFFDTESKHHANTAIECRPDSELEDREHADDAIEELQALVSQAQTALRDSKARLREARAQRKS